MSVRAVVLGLLVAVGIAAFGYFNDWVLNQPYMAADLAPVSAFGLLLAILAGNGLLRKAGGQGLRRAEVCVIFAIPLVACVVPGPGLMWGFGNALMQPHVYQRQRPGWMGRDLVGHVPEVMLARPGFRGQAAEQFVRGLGEGGPADPAAVPWEAWSATLGFWVPLVALGFVATICLAVVLHRQWSRRERLRYPLAEFAASLTGGGTPLRRRVFWTGFAVSFAVLAINAFNAWSVHLWQRPALQIPMQFDLSAVSSSFPVVASVPYGPLFRPAVWFAAVGLAFLTTTDVSFSIGISAVVWAVAFIGLNNAGVDTSWSYLGGGLLPFMAMGAYAAAAATILYVGRRYYLALAGRMVGLARRADVPTGAVWAGRIGLAAAGGMVAILVVRAELHWSMAVLFVLLTGMLFLVVARINVETGLFLVQPCWHAVGVILAIFGAAALGARTLVALALLCTVMSIDPRVCLLPLAANALRLADRGRVRTGPIASAMGVGLLVALVVGVFATLYVMYSYGADSLYFWAKWAAAYPFDMLLQAEGRGLLRDGPVAWGLIRPDRRFLWAAGAGMAAVGLCNVLRLRWARWPIHPVLFLVWGTFPSGLFWGSFLAGWACKKAVLKFGGPGAHEKARSFFIGLIAGEFALGIVSMAVALAYALITGLKSPSFRVHP